MTKSAVLVERSYELADSGRSQASIARDLGVSRAAVRDWLRADRDALLARRRVVAGWDRCRAGSCGMIDVIPRADYAYLLGLYLGDGCLSVSAKRVYRLRISCCDDYPYLRELCERAITAAMPGNKVGRIRCEGCTEVYSDSKHWVCLFPQHGPGRKHERPIVLAPWQQSIVEEHPREFLRGLVHSDGCRCINRVTVRGKRYEYSRYFFTNASDDIRMLFGDACDRIGVEWRHNNKRSISVARRKSVALLDEFIGPKS